jgi:hypothetical protein
VLAPLGGFYMEKMVLLVTFNKEKECSI